MVQLEILLLTLSILTLARYIFRLNKKCDIGLNGKFAILQNYSAGSSYQLLVNFRRMTLFYVNLHVIGMNYQHCNTD